ncbi:MAG: hypothetical protein V4548_10030 [Bacteroidota bacterium]
MKKTLCLYILIFAVIQLKAQETFYRPTSNLAMNNTEKGNLDIGINHEFGNQQLQAIYNLSEKYFVFGTLNINRAKYTYQTFLGGERTAQEDNSGFSFGGGIQKFGRIGNYKYLELIGGVELQNVDRFEFSPYYPDDIDYLSEKYFKLFLQFNMMKNRKNYDFGYSLKLGYLKFADYKSTNGEDFNGQHFFLLDPTLNFNFKFLPKRNLKLTTQIGFSVALNEISDRQYFDSGGYTETTNRLFAGILKIGLQYYFPIQKKENNLTK